LIPYMELLFRSYRYNWIYGSPNGGYLAFNPEVAPRFDAAIAKAKALAYGGSTGAQPGIWTQSRGIPGTEVRAGQRLPFQF